MMHPRSSAKSLRMITQLCRQLLTSEVAGSSACGRGSRTCRVPGSFFTKLAILCNLVIIEKHVHHTGHVTSKYIYIYGYINIAWHLDYHRLGISWDSHPRYTKRAQLFEIRIADRVNHKLHAEVLYIHEDLKIITHVHIHGVYLMRSLWSIRRRQFKCVDDHA